MSVKENINKTFGAIFFAIMVGYFTVFIPHTIITSVNDLSFEIGKFRFTGLILIFAGVFGYLWCLLNFIIDAKGTPLPLGSQKHLIIKGLYRFVRNPMYLSAYLIFFGESLFFQSFLLLFYLFLWIVFFHIKVVAFEEPALQSRFGELYDNYCSSVRRWIPRITPFHGDNKNQSKEFAIGVRPTQLTDMFL